MINIHKHGFQEVYKHPVLYLSSVKSHKTQTGKQKASRKKGLKLGLRDLKFFLLFLIIKERVLVDQK